MERLGAALGGLARPGRAPLFSFSFARTKRFSHTRRAWGRRVYLVTRAGALLCYPLCLFSLCLVSFFPPVSFSAVEPGPDSALSSIPTISLLPRYPLAPVPFSSMSLVSPCSRFASDHE